MSSLGIALAIQLSLVWSFSLPGRDRTSAAEQSARLSSSNPRFSYPAFTYPVISYRASSIWAPTINLENAPNDQQQAVSRSESGRTTAIIASIVLIFAFIGFLSLFVYRKYNRKPLFSKDDEDGLGLGRRDSQRLDVLYRQGPVIESSRRRLQDSLHDANTLARIDKEVDRERLISVSQKCQELMVQHYRVDLAQATQDCPFNTPPTRRYAKTHAESDPFRDDFKNHVIEEYQKTHPRDSVSKMKTIVQDIQEEPTQPEKSKIAIPVKIPNHKTGTKKSVDEVAKDEKRAVDTPMEVMVHVPRPVPRPALVTRSRSQNEIPPLSVSARTGRDLIAEYLKRTRSKSSLTLDNPDQGTSKNRFEDFRLNWRRASPSLAIRQHVHPRIYRPGSIASIEQFSLPRPSDGVSRRPSYSSRRSITARSSLDEAATSIACSEPSANLLVMEEPSLRRFSIDCSRELASELADVSQAIAEIRATMQQIREQGLSKSHQEDIVSDMNSDPERRASPAPSYTETIGS